MIALGVLFVVLLIVPFAFSAFSEVFGAILYHLGNPLARWLGLQGQPTAMRIDGKKTAEVVSVDGEVIRVAFEGSTWLAAPSPTATDVAVGDRVTVTGNSGITLLIEKIASKAGKTGKSN